jgi:hypothetical protein
MKNINHNLYIQICKKYNKPLDELMLDEKFKEIFEKELPKQTRIQKFNNECFTERRDDLHLIQFYLFRLRRNKPEFRASEHLNTKRFLKYICNVYYFRNLRIFTILKESSSDENIGLGDLLNQIAESKSYPLTFQFPKKSIYNKEIVYLYSLIKYLQDTEKYPIYDKELKRITSNVFSRGADYNDFVSFYASMPASDKVISKYPYFSAYLYSIDKAIRAELEEENIEINSQLKNKDNKLKQTNLFDFD